MANWIEQLRAEIEAKCSEFMGRAIDAQNAPGWNADESCRDAYVESVKYLRSIAARLSSMAADTWRPIETAPSDGTRYLATDGVTITIENRPPGYMPGTWHRSREGGGWSGYASRPIGYTPTHWMEEPAQPSVSGQECRYCGKQIVRGQTVMWDKESGREVHSGCHAWERDGRDQRTTQRAKKEER